MKLWIDDMRDAPDDSWTVVRKVQAAIRFLATQKIEEISIDHDIENRPSDETFQPVAYFIAERWCVASERHAPKVTIHSDNPVGAREIQAILSDHGITAEWKPFTSDADFKKKYGL